LGDVFFDAPANKALRKPLNGCHGHCEHQIPFGVGKLAAISAVPVAARTPIKLAKID